MSQNIIPMKTPLDSTDDGNEDIIQKPKVYAKDSLDRFGDDLFELLLTHLSLSDRFRLQSVSKQFQRKVFGSVVDIKIGDPLIQKSLNSQTLATIAIKCPNIQTIDFQREVREEIIAYVLTTFGDQLRDVYCLFGPNCDQWLATYGSRVTRINCNYDFRQSLIQCNRLSHLWVDNLVSVFDTTSGQLLAKNLKSFDVIYGSEDIQLLTAFVSGNLCLKSLTIHLNRNLPEMSQQLSRLRQLRKLKLSYGVMNGENSLSEFLRTIGLNCKQLQRLSLTLYSDCILNGQTLDPLRYYPRLRRLDLSMGFNFVAPSDVLTPLRLCHRLTHLTLYQWPNGPINGQLLVDCDKQWPKLQYLYIRCDAISGECLDHISRHPALKTQRISTFY